MDKVYAPGSFPLAERLKPFPPFGAVTIHDYRRFWNFTDRTPTCWLWTGHVVVPVYGTLGQVGPTYGRFSLQHSLYLANRVAYFLHHKQDPGRSLVLHTCDVSLCVNHDHLYLGDHDDNMRDRSERGPRPTGSWNPAARLKESDVPVIMRRHLAGETLKAIAVTYGVSLTTIHAVVTGTTWRHVPRQ